MCFLWYRLTDNAAKNPRSTLLQLVKPLHQAPSPPSQTFVDSRGRAILPQGTLSIPWQVMLTGNRINAASWLQLLMQRSSCIFWKIAILLLERAEDNGTRPEHGRNTAGTNPEHSRNTSTLYSTCENNKIPGIITMNRNWNRIRPLVTSCVRRWWSIGFILWWSQVSLSTSVQADIVCCHREWRETRPMISK